MVRNDRRPPGKEAEIEVTLDEPAQKLAEMVLRAYKREQAKKGGIENGEERM